MQSNTHCLPSCISVLFGIVFFYSGGFFFVLPDIFKNGVILVTRIMGSRCERDTKGHALCCINVGVDFVDYYRRLRVYWNAKISRIPSKGIFRLVWPTGSGVQTWGRWRNGTGHPTDIYIWGWYSVNYSIGRQLEGSNPKRWPLASPNVSLPTSYAPSLSASSLHSTAN